jgi:polysaccharide deacetylase 2 family uncharacterized protein YibQ
MKKYAGYRIAVLILSLVIIIQWLVIFTLTKPKKPPKPVEVIVKAKIAIVLDDWGYNLNNVPIIEQLKYPITVSVLPSLSYSRLVSEELGRRGFEVILHLPMEPREKYKLEKNTVTTAMSEATIANILSRDLDSIVNAKGVSNHMGSRATENPRTMGVILKEIEKRNLYFLDSFVSARSVCADVAGKEHVKFAKRDVFLDNQQEPGYIRSQIKKLKTKAKVFGQAIGIGHDHKVTLEVLREAMPELEKEGYKFVFVSELAH